MQQESDVCLNLLINSTLKKKQHSPEEIAKAFRIDEYGSIWWNEFTHGNKIMRKPVDRLGKDGYKRITLKEVTYSAHQVAFCLYYGRWPVLAIDHINGVRNDNRKENLREVTNSENQRNRVKSNKANTSGVAGVIWDRTRNQFIARIRVGSKRLNKRCKSLEEAACVRKVWEEAFGFSNLMQPRN